MQKYLTQMLDEINSDPKSIDKYKDNFLLKVIFAHSFLPDYKMLLPEGEPPFKAGAEPMGMTPTNLFAEAKRFYVFMRKDLAAINCSNLLILYSTVDHCSTLYSDLRSPIKYFKSAAFQTNQSSVAEGLGPQVIPLSIFNDINGEV